MWRGALCIGELKEGYGTEEDGTSNDTSLLGFLEFQDRLWFGG